MLSLPHLRVRNNERGDTIVEVLISIAVVSLILGGAYVTTNNSLQATRSAEERSDGLKVVESQLESIKGLSVSDPDALYSTTGGFCVSNGVIRASTNAACKVDARGIQTANTTKAAYEISVVRTNSTFVITNNWDALGGGREKLQMTYKVYRND